MFHFLLLYQGCTPLREARMGSFFALILWKLLTRMRIVFCRGGLGLLCLGTMCGEVNTQNMYLKLRVRKYLQFYAENFCLSKPVGAQKNVSSRRFF